MSVYAEDIQFIKNTNCNEHINIVRKIDKMMYLILSNIIYTVYFHGIPEHLIELFKLLN